MVMYDFLLNLWVSGRVTEQQIQSYADYGFITQEQADKIIATPKNT